MEMIRSRLTLVGLLELLALLIVVLALLGVPLPAHAIWWVAGLLALAGLL